MPLTHLYVPPLCPHLLPQVLSELLQWCDIFSPNEMEAVSLVGQGTPLELADR